MYVQPHKPIVGDNCFVHESGHSPGSIYIYIYILLMKIVYEIVALYVYNCPNILQDGILKNRSTYEILSPEDVGIVKSENSGIVLGKLR